MAVTNTPLKRGVNESRMMSWCWLGRGFTKALSHWLNSNIPAAPMPPPMHIVTRP
jgi:hypothetical protein